jgi:hypothetical protein
VPVTITPENSEVAVYYQVGQTSTGQVSNLNGQTLLYGTSVYFTAVPVPMNYPLPTDASNITATPATGSVTVSDNGVVIGAGLVLNGSGQAFFKDSNLAVGIHSLVASYAGDLSYNPSNTTSPLATPMNFIVGATSTTLKLEPFYQEVLPGGTGFVTAYIAVEGQAAPTGTVTFSVTSSVGTATLPPVAVTFTVGSNAVAAVTIPASALVAGPPTLSQAGNNTVTATYSGDSNYQPAAQQTAAAIYDAQSSTNIFLFIAPGAPVAGQSTALTARVGWINLLSIPGYPGGSVDFLDGTNPLGTVTTAPDAYGNGVATFTTSTLTAGVHTLTANYSGNTQFLPSTALITVTVAQAVPPPPPPALDFTLSATPATLSGGTNASSTSTLTATLNGPAAAAGSITLSCTPPARFPAISCSVPASMSFAAGATTATSNVTVSISGLTASLDLRKPGPRWPVAAGALSLALLLPLGFGRRRRGWRALLSVLLLLALATGLGSCGFWGSLVTVPVGNYSVTVSGTLGAVSHQTTIPVIVQ